MAASDQRQKLVNKIYSTNNTISVIKKEVDNLKKKHKKAIDISKPRKSQKYSKEIANKEDIIGPICLALARQAEELKTLASRGCNTVNDNNTSGTKKSHYDSDESSVQLEETE